MESPHRPAKPTRWARQIAARKRSRRVRSRNEAETTKVSHRRHDAGDTFERDCISAILKRAEVPEGRADRRLPSNYDRWLLQHAEPKDLKGHRDRKVQPQAACSRPTCSLTLALVADTAAYRAEPAHGVRGGGRSLGRGQTAPSPSLPPFSGEINLVGHQSEGSEARARRLLRRSAANTYSRIALVLPLIHVRCAVGSGRVSPLRSQIPRGRPLVVSGGPFRGETRLGWRPTQVSGLGSKRRRGVDPATLPPPRISRPPRNAVSGVPKADACRPALADRGVWAATSLALLGGGSL